MVPHRLHETKTADATTFRVNQPLIQKKIAIVTPRNSTGKINIKRVTAQVSEVRIGIGIVGIKTTGPNRRINHESRPVLQYRNAAIRSIAPKTIPTIPNKDETDMRYNPNPKLTTPNKTASTTSNHNGLGLNFKSSTPFLDIKNRVPVEA
jgi:hypothetical protein